MVQAFRAALEDAGCTLGDLDFRITDVSGEQYMFKEAALAMTRLLRKRKEEFDIWHPADCIGETGAAIGPVIFNVVMTATQKVRRARIHEKYADSIDRLYDEAHNSICEGRSLILDATYRDW